MAFAGAYIGRGGRGRARQGREVVTASRGVEAGQRWRGGSRVDARIQR